MGWFEENNFNVNDFSEYLTKDNKEKSNIKCKCEYHPIRLLMIEDYGWDYCPFCGKKLCIRSQIT